MEIPRYWRLKKQRYSLVGEVCPDCKTALFPPRAVCPHCAEAARETARAMQEEPVLMIPQRLQTIDR